MKFTGVVEGQQAVLARLSAVTPKAMEAINAAVARAGYEVEALAVEKVSGGVLKVRTGRLRRSIHTNLERGPTSSYATVGTNVSYARILEMGGTIHHPGGTAYLIDRASGMARFIPNADPLAASLPRTRAHDIPIPEHSFLRSALREKRPKIIEDLRAAATQAML